MLETLTNVRQSAGKTLREIEGNPQRLIRQTSLITSEDRVRSAWRHAGVDVLDQPFIQTE